MKNDSNRQYTGLAASDNLWAKDKLKEQKKKSSKVNKTNKLINSAMDMAGRDKDLLV